ncbi:MAG TPA: hypothetical protein VIK07_06215 [Bacteroidales bacterium]
MVLRITSAVTGSTQMFLIVVREINMEAEISADESGGFGIQYLGGSSIMINGLKVDWK